MARPTTKLAGTAAVTHTIGDAFDELGYTTDERTTNNRVVRYHVTCNRCKTLHLLPKLRVLNIKACPACKAGWLPTEEQTTVFVTATRLKIVNAAPVIAVRTLDDPFYDAWVSQGSKFYVMASETDGEASNEAAAFLHTARSESLNAVKAPDMPERQRPVSKEDLRGYQGFYGTATDPPNQAFSAPESAPWVLVTKNLYDAFKHATPDEWAQLEVAHSLTLPKNSRTSIATNLPEQWLYVYYPPTLALPDSLDELD